MKDILFIQPWDRPWAGLEYITRRQKMYISRAQFEVCFQVPEKYSLINLDLNLEIRSGCNIETAVINAMAQYQPRIVMISMPVYVLGEQIGRIIATIERSGQNPAIIIGGSEISLIHDLPSRLWPSVSCCYNGFGQELTFLIEACLENKQPSISGVYWQGNSCNSTSRGLAHLIDGYSPDEFYTAHGRVDFNHYLNTIRNVGLEPMGILEMSRGCPFWCDFCAINGRRLGFYHRSPQTVVQEAYFLAEHKVQYLHLIDPTFGANRKNADELFGLLAEFHKEWPDVCIEVLTRPELVTGQFTEALARAGICRCGIGMETMGAEKLDSVSKALKPSETRQAIYRLAEHNIETKLFHIVFPHHISTETIAFFLELSQEDIPFIVQTSFLRTLPSPTSTHPFITQDQTVFVQGADTREQLMEYILANLAFPSMDTSCKGDGTLREVIGKIIKKGAPLESLFSVNENGLELSLKSWRLKQYTYVHRDAFPVADNFH